MQSWQQIGVLVSDWTMIIEKKKKYYDGFKEDLPKTIPSSFKSLPDCPWLVFLSCYWRCFTRRMLLIFKLSCGLRPCKPWTTVHISNILHLFKIIKICQKCTPNISVKTCWNLTKFWSESINQLENWIGCVRPIFSYKLQILTWQGREQRQLNTMRIVFGSAILN